MQQAATAITKVITTMRIQTEGVVYFLAAAIVTRSGWYNNLQLGTDELAVLIELHIYRSEHLMGCGEISTDECFGAQNRLIAYSCLGI